MSEKTDPKFKHLTFEDNYAFKYTDLEQLGNCTLHRHPEFEFVYIKSGSSAYQIGSDVIHAEKGDLLFIWPGELHTFVYVPDKTTLFVQFKSDVLDGYADIRKDLPLLYPLHHIRSSEYPDVANAVSYNLLEGYRYYSACDDYVQSFFQSRLIDLFTSLLHFVKQHSIPQNESGPEYADADADWTIRSKIADACRYIDQNSFKNITQTEVANKIGFSHYYFSRKFKQLTSYSFPEYLSQKRLIRASELLVKTAMSITEVAFSSGFQSISSFNKIFKDAFGISPKEYRKRYGNEPI